MIRYNDIPRDRLTQDYLDEHYNIAAAKEKVGGAMRYEPMMMKGAVESEPLFEEVWEYYRRIGAVHWQSRESMAIYGASLYYNPERPEEEWHKGSFGTKRYLDLHNKDYYNAQLDIKKFGGEKGDYVDLYAFRQPHPFIEAALPALHEFLSGCNLPIVRVTARTLNGMFNIGGGYHVDSEDSFNLRFNVCLSNNGTFGLQYEGRELVIPEPGDIQLVSTAYSHSNHATARTNFQRTALIIDVIPWYRYDSIADGWEPNEYFGQIHPYDMVKEGLVTFGGLGK